MQCRYSSRAARDTKHWPQAKTNYTGLRSPRNAFYPWRSPSESRETASRTSSLSSMWSTSRSPDDANRFLSYLLRFVSRRLPPPCSGKLGQRATASRRFGVIVTGGNKGRMRGRPRRGNEEQGSVRFESGRN